MPGLRWRWFDLGDEGRTLSSRYRIGGKGFGCTSPLGDPLVCPAVSRAVDVSGSRGAALALLASSIVPPGRRLVVSPACPSSVRCYVLSVSCRVALMRLLYLPLEH